MRYLLLFILLVAGCYLHQRMVGQCLAHGGYILQVEHTRGFTMVYVRQWDSYRMSWSGEYPADTWTLLGLDTVDCPTGGK